MKKIAIATCLLFASFQPLSALMAPLSQSIKEIEAIFSSPEFTQMLSPQETIQEIQHVDEGYFVCTNQSELFVELEYQTQTRPGPRQFHLIFHEPKRLN